MAREIDEIYNDIMADVSASETLNASLYSTSKTALYALFAYIIASAIWALEKIFDIHKNDVEDIIESLKPGTLLWYRNKALAFQYGYSLPDGDDEYETIDEDAQIIAFSAANEIETETGTYIQIKVAKDENGSLAELSEDEMAAFIIYIERIKYAGVRIRKTSQEADHLRLVIDIYYDPLVLDNQGQRIDGTNNSPAQDSITDYLENLPFNGEFSIMALTDALQEVDGIKIPQILSADEYWGSYDWEVISAKYIPEAGWMRVYNAESQGIEIIITEYDDYTKVIDGDLTINWRPYNQ